MGPVTGFFQQLFTHPFKTLFGLAFNFLKGLFVSLGAGLAGLLASFKVASDSALSFSKAALSLRANNGLSPGQSGGLIRRGFAFGMSADETAGNFSGRNPLTAGIFGNDYRSPDYYSKLSQQFNSGINSGPLGFLFTRGLLKAQGASDSDLNIAAMNPRKVQAQEQWSNNIGAKFGLDSKSIADNAESLTLGLSKLVTIFELLKLKLWGAIGPQVVGAIEAVGGLLTRNADRIANIFAKVGGAFSGVFLKGLEVAIGFLDANAGKVASFIESAFDWLFFSAPALALNAASVGAKGLSIFFGVISSGIEFLMKESDSFAKFFAKLTKGFIDFVPKVLGVVDSLLDGFKYLQNGLKSLVNGVQGIIEDAARGANTLPFVNLNQPEFKRQQLDMSGPSSLATDPATLAIFNNAANAVNDFVQNRNADVQYYGGKGADTTDVWSKFWDDKSKSWSESAKNAPDDMRKLLEENNMRLAEANQLAREQMNKQEGFNRQLINAVNVAARINAYNAQDAALADVR